ncbi:MAG: acyl-CoA mutase large subunit family protein [Deltaproteobacteria bacterium]|nr:acyl-CoA mutase large subunit family protein [Deltaproteobacteria bacterium]
MTDKTVSVDRNFGHMVRTATQSHIELKSHYGPEDVKDISYTADRGDPGEYPFARGLYPDMYRDRLWLKSFIVSYSTPEETNEAFRKYIDNGMTDLRLLADLPTQSGIDPDHPFAWNSMMCGGVATYALPVYDRMLEGVPMEAVVCELAHSSISNFIYFYSLLVALMEIRGLDVTKLRGNSINDPVRAKLVYASPDFPTNIARRICLDHIAYSVRHTPKWRPFAPNGVDPCQGGMDAVRELGGCLAVALAICKDLRERGISIDDYGPMVFSLDAESDFFETIAKFRAARMMWAKLAREKLGARTQRATQLKIGIRTSGLSLQNQKPLNNAARVTLQILSCVLGGVNSVDASSIDEAIGLPSYEARVFNLDTQHIITHEANIPLVADPLAGSYHMEWLTSELEKRVTAYLNDVEARGGIFECLESGWLNSIMEENRLRIQREKAEGKRLIVGVNAFRDECEEGPINSAIRGVAYKAPSETLRRERIEEVKAFKEGRDQGALRRTLKQLYDDTKEGKNVTRSIIDAAKIGATLGEVTGVIRLAYGIPYDPFEQMDTPIYVQQSLEDRT